MEARDRCQKKREDQDENITARCANNKDRDREKFELFEREEVEVEARKKLLVACEKERRRSTIY